MKISRYRKVIWMIQTVKYEFNILEMISSFQPVTYGVTKKPSEFLMKHRKTKE